MGGSELIIIDHTDVSAELQGIINLLESNNTSEAKSKTEALLIKINKVDPRCARGTENPSLVGLYVDRALNSE